MEGKYFPQYIPGRGCGGLFLFHVLLLAKKKLTKNAKGNTRLERNSCGLLRNRSPFSLTLKIRHFDMKV